uniref:Uncharacterized protein n=1 Tax=Rhipicephalus appendiculatus TaxID=34631 RepID=A0A131YBV4_RHIAP
MHIVRERVVTYITFKKHRQAGSTARGKYRLVLSFSYEQQLYRTRVTPVPAPYFLFSFLVHRMCHPGESVYFPEQAFLNAPQAKLDDFPRSL